MVWLPRVHRVFDIVRRLPLALIVLAASSSSTTYSTAVAAFGTNLPSSRGGWRWQQTPLSIVYHSADTTVDSNGAGNTPDTVQVTLKIAIDQQGGVFDLSPTSTNERFTCDESLDMVHRLRARSDAILVGKSTVIQDNPSLLVRRGVPCEHQPLRVILDPGLSLLQTNDNEYQIFIDGHNTVVYHSEIDVDDALLDLDERCVSLVYLPSTFQSKRPDEDNNTIAIPDLLRDLSERFGVRHVMVEGGPVTAAKFLEAHAVDRCLLVKAPISFAKPLPSGIIDQVFSDASLVKLGEIDSGVDTIECWSKVNLPWPSESLSDWP